MDTAWVTSARVTSVNDISGLDCVFMIGKSQMWSTSRCFKYDDDTVGAIKIGQIFYLILSIHSLEFETIGF